MEVKSSKKKYDLAGNSGGYRKSSQRCNESYPKHGECVGEYMWAQICAYIAKSRNAQWNFPLDINNRAYGRYYKIQFNYIKSYPKGW